MDIGGGGVGGYREGKYGGNMAYGLDILLDNLSRFFGIGRY